MALGQAYAAISSAKSVMSDYAGTMLNIICILNELFFFPVTQILER